jgi:phospholipid-binding lipoprotein MlaA
MIPFFLEAALLLTTTTVYAPDQRLPLASLPLSESDLAPESGESATRSPSAVRVLKEVTTAADQSSVKPEAQPVADGEGEGEGEGEGDQMKDAVAPAPTSAEEIVISGRRRSSSDPLERVNEQSYKAVQAVDGAVVAPLARGYKRGIPKPVRDGIHNFLDHVQEPVVFLNYLLQLKPGKAAETAGRFVVNTTVGLVGVIDVAKKRPFNLPHRTNGLGNTLGYYGVGPGPYFFLPLIGPTTMRDLLGTSVDRLVLPATLGAPFNKPYYAIPTNVLSALDYRVAADEKLATLHNAEDPYAATRKDYLERRKAEIGSLHSPEWRARHSFGPSGPPLGGTSSAPVATGTVDQLKPQVSDTSQSLLKP